LPFVFISVQWNQEERKKSRTEEKETGMVIRQRKARGAQIIGGQTNGSI